MPFTAAKLGAVHASVIVVVRGWRGAGSWRLGSSACAEASLGNHCILDKRDFRGCGLAGVAPIPEGQSANRSLSTVEPVSTPRKWKLKNGEQRPASETRPAGTEIPEIADQRPGRANLTRGNVADSHTPGYNTPEARLIRTFESRDARQTVRRLALNFHRRKEWTSSVVTAPGAVVTEKDPQMSHSKIPRKTEVARAKSRANRPAKPSNIPSGSTRSGTKKEAVLAQSGGVLRARAG